CVLRASAVNGMALSINPICKLSFLNLNRWTLSRRPDLDRASHVHSDGIVWHAGVLNIFPHSLFNVTPRPVEKKMLRPRQFDPHFSPVQVKGKIAAIAADDTAMFASDQPNIKR
ncbi:MAG TPA: hypothetical protein VFY40_22225, partial [Blastocatellia bacterium]|nr:hypothetical protein [Blastocatellia bacterium]